MTLKRNSADASSSAGMSASASSIMSVLRPSTSSALSAMPSSPPSAAAASSFLITFWKKPESCFPSVTSAYSPIVASSGARAAGAAVSAHALKSTGRKFFANAPSAAAPAAPSSGVVRCATPGTSPISASSPPAAARRHAWHRFASAVHTWSGAQGTGVRLSRWRGARDGRRERGGERIHTGPRKLGSVWSAAPRRRATPGKAARQSGASRQSAGSTAHTCRGAHVTWRLQGRAQNAERSPQNPQHKRQEAGCRKQGEGRSKMRRGGPRLLVHQHQVLGLDREPPAVRLHRQRLRRRARPRA